MPIPTIYLIIIAVFLTCIAILINTLKNKGKTPEQNTSDALENGNKVAAIKRYREQHNVDLKTAKEAIEKMQSKSNQDTPTEK